MNLTRLAAPLFRIMTVGFAAMFWIAVMKLLMLRYPIAGLDEIVAII